MILTLVSRTLRDQHRLFVGWVVGLAALLLVLGAMWPSIRDMPGFDELLAGYPKGMRELFNLDAMSTGLGFFNAELFTLVLPALFIGFGVTRGAWLIAGEEEAGITEVLLVTPLSTTTLYLGRAAALTVSVFLLGGVVASLTLLMSALFSMEVSPLDAAIGSLAMGLIGLEYGLLALSVGAMTGRRTVALVVGGVAAVAGYVVYVAGLLVTALDPLLPWSPFYQALEGGPLSSTFPPRLGWLVLGSVVVLFAGIPLFARRDNRAGR